MPQAIAAAASWVASAATAAAAEAGVTSLVAAKVIYAAAYAATYATISYGATSAVSALTKPKVSSQGTQTDVQLDPQAPIPGVLGRTKVGGKVVYTTTVGEKNKYLLFYRVLAGGAPNEGFEAFEANNTAITFGTDGGEGASGVFQNRLWMKRSLDGGADYAGLRFTATGTKDTPADHGGNPSEWTAAHRLSGYMCSLMGVEFDATKFSGGPPKPGDVIKGWRAYDPRLDSTYPGGSGPQRWADPADTAAFTAAMATWPWTQNPYLLGLAYALGRWTRDESNPAAVYRRTLGVGAPIDKIIVEQFVEGANVADANGWTVGGEITSADGKWDTLATILQAGGGEPMRLGAKIGCFVNMPRVSIATLTGDDLADGEITIPATASRRDRINRVYPRYRSEAHDWEIVTGGPIEVSAYVTADGGWRSREVDFPLVQDVDQASQLAALHIVNQREFGPGTLPLKPRWLGLKPGDCVTLDIPAANLTSEKVLIKARQLDPSTAARTISFVSETDAKHDYVLGRTGTAPPIPSLTASDLIPATPDVADWAAVGGVQSGPGGTLPVIVLTGVVRDVHAVAVIVDYRLVSAGPTYGPWLSREWPNTSLALNGDGDPEVSLELTGLAPGATYQVRVRYRTIRGVEDPAVSLDLGEVVAGDVGAIILSPDAVPPGVPTALALSSAISLDTDGTQIVTLSATWTGVADSDLSHYELALKEGSGSLIVFPTVGGAYSVRAPANTAFTAKILAVDVWGNRSAYSSTVTHTTTRDTMAPAAPTSLAVSASVTSLWLSWTNPTAADLDHVDIYEHTSNSSGAATRFATVPARSAQAGGYSRGGLASGVTRYYWLKAVDTSGNVSAFSSVASGATATVGPGDLDTTAPGVPTGLALSSSLTLDTDGSQIITLLATWAAVSASDLAYYDVQIKEAAGGFVSAACATTRREWPVKAGVSYTVKVRAVDQLGNRSAFSSDVTATATADSTPPGAPSGLSAASSVGSVFLSWTNPSDGDLSAVDIYENTTNSSGTAVLVGTVNALPGQAGGLTRSGLVSGVTRYYWVKAIDTSGNRSGFSAVASTTTALVGNGDVGVGALYGDKIQAGTLLGDRFNTTTSLPGTITVGSTGVSIGTVESRASDPAARVNAQSTLIQPGKVLISGGTTLLNWRSGADNTKIDGGNLYANTVAANALQIGSRGLTVSGLDFSVVPSTGVVSWTAGTIAYVNDAGTATSRSISAGSVSSLGVIRYFYWDKDSTSIGSVTSVTAIPASSAAVHMATYNGGAGLNVLYGGTIIDGSRIRAHSVTADELLVTDLSAISANLGTISVGSANITDLAVTNLKIGSSAVSTIKMVDNSVTDAQAGSKTSAVSGMATFVAAFTAITWVLAYPATVICWGDAVMNDGGGNPEGYHAAGIRTLVVESGGAGLVAAIGEYQPVGKYALGRLPMVASIDLPAGTYTFTLQVMCKPDDNHTACNLITERFYK